MKYWYVTYFFETVVTFSSFDEACHRMDILRDRGIKAVLSSEKFVLCDNSFPMTESLKDRMLKKERKLQSKDWRYLLNV